MAVGGTVAIFLMDTLAWVVEDWGAFKPTCIADLATPRGPFALCRSYEDGVGISPAIAGTSERTSARAPGHLTPPIPFDPSRHCRGGGGF